MHLANFWIQDSGVSWDQTFCICNILQHGLFFWQRGRNILTGVKKEHCLHPKYNLSSFSVVCAESDFVPSWLQLLFPPSFSWAHRCHEVELEGHSHENVNLGAVCSVLGNVTFQFGEKFPRLFFPGKIPVFSTLQRSDEKSSRAVNQEMEILWLSLYCVHAENPFWLPHCKCTKTKFSVC